MSKMYQGYLYDNIIIQKVEKGYKVQKQKENNNDDNNNENICF
jgi:hypothetical protein